MFNFNYQVTVYDSKTHKILAERLLDSFDGAKTQAHEELEHATFLKKKVAIIITKLDCLTQEEKENYTIELEN